MKREVSFTVISDIIGFIFHFGDFGFKKNIQSEILTVHTKAISSRERTVIQVPILFKV